jgi:hypothetical protein
MTPMREQVAHLVMRIQNDFLDHPTLALTLDEAQERFDVDEVDCVGVLGALVEARVLAQREGAYRMNHGRQAPGKAA